MLKINENPAFKRSRNSFVELRSFLSKLQVGQSLTIPADYMTESKDKRAAIAVNCLRMFGKGAFQVQKQEDGSYEALRTK